MKASPKDRLANVMLLLNDAAAVVNTVLLFAVLVGVDESGSMTIVDVV